MRPRRTDCQCNRQCVMERSTARLFLALWPGQVAQAGALAWQTAHGWPPGTRLTPPQNLHITLHFIGPVPRERLAEIATGLAVPSPRLELRLDHIEAWPHGLVVLAPTEVPGALLEVHANLGRALRDLQLPMETRRYRPHVTLARDAALPTSPPGPIAPVRWRAQGYVLVASEGGRYRVLQRYRV